MGISILGGPRVQVERRKTRRVFEKIMSPTIKNETGYGLEEVKYVLEAGDTKTLVEQAQDVPNGGSCTFRLEQEGAYRIYASLTIDGKRVYAKGNSYNLRDGGSYRLTLQKVVSSQPRRHELHRQGRIRHHQVMLSKQACWWMHLAWSLGASAKRLEVWCHTF